MASRFLIISINPAACSIRIHNLFSFRHASPTTPEPANWSIASLFTSSLYILYNILVSCAIQNKKNFSKKSPPTMEEIGMNSVFSGSLCNPVIIVALTLEESVSDF